MKATCEEKGSEDHICRQVYDADLWVRIAQVYAFQSGWQDSIDKYTMTVKFNITSIWIASWNKFNVQNLQNEAINQKSLESYLNVHPIEWGFFSIGIGFAQPL